MLDTRLVNVSKEMTNIVSMQTMIDFCVDKGNISSMYLKYDLTDIANSPISSGDRNDFDYKIMTMILQKLKTQYEESLQETKEKIEDFIEKNIKHFLAVCPINLISNPICPKNILLDIAKGKYSDIKVKNIHSRETIEGKYKEKISDNAYCEFSDKYGWVLAKIMLNIRKLKLKLPNGRKPDLEEICTVFTNGFRMPDKVNTNQNKEVIMETIGQNKENVRLVETIHTNSSYDSIEATIYEPNNIYKDISTQTLQFLSKSFKAITKGVIPFSLVKKENSISKKDIKRISLYIDYENSKREVNN